MHYYLLTFNAWLAKANFNYILLESPSVKIVFNIRSILLTKSFDENHLFLYSYILQIIYYFSKTILPIIVFWEPLSS